MWQSWSHDDVIKWKHFPCYWTFVWGIHRSSVNSRSFDVFFDLRLNKWLRKQSWGGWFEMLCCPIRCHINVRHCMMQSMDIAKNAWDISLSWKAFVTTLQVIQCVIIWMDPIQMNDYDLDFYPAQRNHISKHSMAAACDIYFLMVNLWFLNKCFKNNSSLTNSSECT